MPDPSACPLCATLDDNVIWRDELCRVVTVDDPYYAGYCRVIWHEHVAEVTDLTLAAQRHLMNVVLATETALRRSMRPDKINLASFGNFVPHLHWHVIPRFSDDRHFPEAIWGTPQRDGARRATPHAAALTRAIDTALAELTSG